MTQATPTRTILGKWKIHPLCDRYPDMVGEQFDEMVESVRKYGVIENPVMLDGMVLDGKNRIRAADVAGKPVITREASPVEKRDPEAFVERKNRHRRHLTPAQLAMKAADLAQPAEGETKSKAVKRAAQETGVPESSVWAADKVKQEAPKAAEEVRQGKASLRSASESAKKPKPSWANEEDGEQDEAKPDPVLDAEGRVIPDKFRHVFTEGADKFGEIKADLTALQTRINVLVKEGETGAGVHIGAHRVKANITQLRDEMKQAEPYSVCPTCAGKGCETCMQLGWVNRKRYDAAGEAVIKVFESKMFGKAGAA